MQLLRQNHSALHQNQTIKRLFLGLILLVGVFIISGAGTSPSGQSNIRIARAAARLNASTQQIVLNESFDGSLNIPTGWQKKDNSTVPGWYVQADVAGGNANQNGNDTGGAQNFAIINSDKNQGAMNGELLTPSLNLTTAQSVRLKFKTRFVAYTFNATNEKAEVDISKDGGTTWQNVWRKTADYTGSETLDITAQAAGSSNVRIRFHYYDADYDYYWKIDDVVVDISTGTPTAPTGLAATANGPIRIDLTWTDTSNDETGFRIERSPNGTNGWTQVGQVNSNVTQFNNNNLTCGTTYHYRVSAINQVGAAVSNVATAATTACPVTVTQINENFNAGVIPAGWTIVQTSSTEPWHFNNPYNRTAETGGAGGFAIADSDGKRTANMDVELRTPVLNFSGQTAVNLQFRSRLRRFQGQFTRASVRVSPDNGTTWSDVWVSQTSHTGNLITLDISPQAAGKANVLVSFRYQANDDYYWQIDDVVIAPPTAPAVGPSNLTANLNNNNLPILAWNGNGGKNFEVWRSTVAGQNGQKITDVVNGVTTYIDRNAVGNNTYYYHVRTVNNIGGSPFSNQAMLQIGNNNRRFFDLKISLYRTPEELTPALRGQYEEIIRYFADAVYEMSNGVHFLRRIEFVPNGAEQNTADVVWVKDCHPSANISGYGRNGLNINMCDIFNGGANYLQQPRLGGWGSFGHEWGHYGFSVYDEYKGSTPCNPNQPSSPCVNDTAVVPSVMHQGDFADTRSDLNWLNLSYASNNTGNNANHRVYNASAWETIARPLGQDPRDGRRNNLPSRLFYPELTGVAPTGNQAPRIDLDINNLPNSPSRGALNIVWRNVPGAAQTNLVERSFSLVSNSALRQIVVDVSSLSNSADNLVTVQAALHQTINQVRLGDVVGIIAYDGTVSTLLPLTEISGPTARDQAHTAVDNLTLGDSDAATGEALQTALDKLTALVDFAERDGVVYLIGGGQTTVGRFPTEIVADYQSNYVRLFTFFTGAAEIDAGGLTLMEQLAGLTDGTAANVGGSRSMLESALTRADNLVSSTVDLVINENYAFIDPSTTETYPFYVDSSLGYLEIEADWFGGLDWGTVKLIDPDGAMIPLDNCELVGDAIETKDQETLCSGGVENPAAGEWTLEVTATAATEESLDLFYWIGAEAQDGVDTFMPFAELPAIAIIDNFEDARLSYPEPVVINAFVNSQNGSVSGIDVTAIIDEPDGSNFEITLRDDGVDPDSFAGDGMYAGIFAPVLNGDYYATIYFDNADANAVVSFSGLADGETIEPLSITERFERAAYLDFAYDAPLVVTDEDGFVILTPDNMPIPGRINGADDFTSYVLDVPADYSNRLIIRVDELGLGMDPFVIAYNKADTWERIEYLDTLPTEDDFLVFELFVEAGERVFIDVYHFEENTTEGTYTISVGPPLASDNSVLNVSSPKNDIFLPILIR